VARAFGYTSAVRVVLRKALAGRLPYIYTPIYKGGEGTPGVLAIGETPPRLARPAISWLTEKKHAPRWYLIGSDYVWPWLSHRAVKRYIAEAMNLTRLLTAAYDAALAEHDLLVMPTPPIKASALTPDDASRELCIESAFEMISNTAPFDITHHPAMAVLCGFSDGLAVSLMLVGKHFDEPTIYKAAFAFEQLGDWKRM
jgi:Amidase/Periplasmic binding protein domain